ncbi:MAG: 1-acyl-sn-glycerol-3-phosphate acyltransferase [Clostridia bacterium]|nr:1-acyl-sn-glycerol-3-phosphate acyltransferase [Clostridia bacterium]
MSESEEKTAKTETTVKKTGTDQKIEKQKKKKPEKKYNLPRHKFWFGIGRPLTMAFLKYKANFKRTKNDLTNRPYMILCNHACDLDPLMVINSVPGIVHALASDHLFKHPVFGKFVAHIAGPIPIVRAQVDLKSIKEAMQVRKDGGSLLIFPEANCCYSAKTSYIAPATAKLVKQFKMPLALFNVKGSYLTKPRWSNSWRRGRTTCELVRVIEPEQLAAMSVDEIYEAICEALSFNEMEYQRAMHVSFKGHDLLDGAERMLFQCPKCGKLMTMKSEGDSVYCTGCGYRVTMNSEGFLEGDDVVFDSLDRWDDWQREQAAKLVSEGRYDTTGQEPVLITPVNELYKTKRASKNVLIGEGSFALYSDRMEFVTDNALETDEEGNSVSTGAKTFVWNFEDITKMSCVHKNRVQIAVGEKDYYEIHSKNTYRSAYAYMIYFYCLKRHAQGKELDFFGM